MSEQKPNPLELALGGMGQAGSSLAPGRQWVPEWRAETPKLINPAGVSQQPKIIRLSILDGLILKVSASPANPDLFIELSRLPTKQQRQGCFGVSLYDLPGVEAVASEQGYTVEHDPAVHALVERWHQWRLEMEWLKTQGETQAFEVAGLNIDFFKFQVYGVNYGTKIGSFLLLDDMGLGKSIQVLGCLYRHLASSGGKLSSLILAPTTVVGDWQAKFEQFAGTKVATATGDRKKRLKVYQSKPETLVLSYDVFMRDVVEISKNFRPQFVAMDECQRIVNRRCKATMKLFEFLDVMQPRFRIPMSGTPMNRPDELWSLLHIINPALAGTAKSFEARYMKQKPIWKKDPKTGRPVMMKIEYGEGDHKRTFTPMRLESLNPDKPNEAKLLSELRYKIAPYIIRRLKKDVLTDLPGKLYETISVVLGKRERDVYEDLQARFAESMAGVADEESEGKVDSFFSWFIKAQQICSSLEITGDGKESSKMDELRTLVNDYAADQKIVIFSRFKDMTDIVVRELKDFNPVYLHGQIDQDKRQPLVDRFQTEDDCRLFVSTLKAGGVGLTLTAGSIVARLDRWVAPSANEQCVDRCFRIGQTRKVTVVDFIVEDSVEQRILEILKNKRRVIASLILADEDEDRQERRVFRSLKKSELLALI